MLAASMIVLLITKGVRVGWGAADTEAGWVTLATMHSASGAWCWLVAEAAEARAAEPGPLERRISGGRGRAKGKKKGMKWRQEGKVGKG